VPEEIAGLTARRIESWTREVRATTAVRAPAAGSAFIFPGWFSRTHRLVERIARSSRNFDPPRLARHFFALATGAEQRPPPSTKRAARRPWGQAAPSRQKKRRCSTGPATSTPPEVGGCAAWRRCRPRVAAAAALRLLEPWFTSVLASPPCSPDERRATTQNESVVQQLGATARGNCAGAWRPELAHPSGTSLSPDRRAWPVPPSLTTRPGDSLRHRFSSSSNPARPALDP